jgi:hypothetical protein
LPHQAYDKRCIAQSQLETALRLFQEGQDFFSVITLAGAADEILGKLVTRQGRDNSLASLKKAAVAMHEHLFGEPGDERTISDRANSARNALKHLDAGDSPTVALDPREEAIDMLNRAIDNYWILESSMTSAMEQFARSQRAT